MNARWRQRRETRATNVRIARCRTGDGALPGWDREPRRLAAHLYRRHDGCREGDVRGAVQGSTMRGSTNDDRSEPEPTGPAAAAHGHRAGADADRARTGPGRGH